MTTVDLTQVLTMRAAVEHQPTDSSAWLALADALEEAGRENTVERMTARALVSMQSQGHDRAIDWIDWMPDGSSGIGTAQDRPFVFRLGNFSWVDTDNSPSADDPLEQTWTVWKNADGWEWACGYETQGQWERLWAITVHGDGSDGGEVHTLPMRGISGMDAIAELTDAVEFEDLPEWAVRAQCYPTGSEDPDDGFWYRRTAEGWVLA